ncbi:MAG: lipoyl(octanoyl) transferase [Ignavibacteria bacterium GWB2_35_12]|nr:MAG: lipoyl(octanoyl) transferase [Ignavibacteria bacterium GWA2_35_8]OGU39633.1 MAG: lipoyl(octanoyl) transferase [Ignavibacteria bacterium GWB2_35_12]OGV24035.1 MAG: lipoyl(octanoyl) transferase [Ignavibacteria bacterium RIFOXYC2_FULL_35_21]
MISIENWGLIEYKESWDKQKVYADEVLNGSRKSTLVLCEHPSVITIGKTGTEGNIIPKPEFLKQMGIDVFNIDRGGDVTLHNPGQLVGYPIFNLADFRQDLHWFLREIEQCIMDLLEVYNISSGRVEGLTGVWIDRQKKICAMGLHCSRWVTSHGFALNVQNNLSEFDYIVPCGIKDKDITSMEKELGIRIEISEIKLKCAEIFEKHF